MRENEREKEEGRSENSKLVRFFFKRLQQSKRRRKQFRYVLLLLRSPQVSVSICGLFWNREQRLLICGERRFWHWIVRQNRMKQRSLRSTPCGSKSNTKTTQYNADMLLYKQCQLEESPLLFSAGKPAEVIYLWAEKPHFVSWLWSFVTQISRHESIR